MSHSSNRTRHGYKYAVTIIIYLSILAISYVITGDSGLTFGLGIGIMFYKCITYIEQRPETNQTRVRIIGLSIILSGICVWLIYEFVTGVNTTTVVPVVFLLATVYLWVDNYRQNDETDAITSDKETRKEVVSKAENCQQIVVQLQSGPKTAVELASLCDMSGNEVKSALDELSTHRAISTTQSSDGVTRYHVDKSLFGLSGLIKYRYVQFRRRLLK